MARERSAGAPRARQEIHDIQELRRFVAHVISVSEAERSQIAHALHESTAQNLVAIVMQLGVLVRDAPDAAWGERLGALQALARDTLEEVRLLSHTAWPRTLEDLGLAEALRQLGRTVDAADLPVLVEVDDGAQPASRTASSVLYWVAQEALLNARRHAHATGVHVCLRRAGERAVLEVADDGDGFDVAEAERRRPGMGLFAMRERVALIEGDLQIVSGREGTRVVATVPLVPRAA